jgi:hypothetical protein
VGIFDRTGTGLANGQAVYENVHGMYLYHLDGFWGVGPDHSKSAKHRIEFASACPPATGYYTPEMEARDMKVVCGGGTLSTLLFIL